jgi:hypothetical protein
LGLALIDDENSSSSAQLQCIRRVNALQGA